MSESSEHSIKLEMTKTNRPLLRGGKANILLGISLAGLFVAGNLLLDKELFLKGLGIALVGLVVSAALTYLRALSRLEFRATDVVAEGPVSRQVVPYNRIERVDIKISRLNPSISIRMQLQGGRVMKRGILAESTEWGGLDATESRIRMEFANRGVFVTAKL